MIKPVMKVVVTSQLSPENNNVGQAWVSGERWGGGLAACAGGTPVSPPVQWGEMSVCVPICSEQLTLSPSLFFSIFFGSVLVIECR
jgi:hypothetical protein